MTDKTHAQAQPVDAVGARAEREVRPLQATAWAVEGKNLAGMNGPAIWLREPTADDHKMWAEVGIVGSVDPLYALAADEVAAVNKLRAQKALKTQKDMSRCQCDHNEYCRHCWPEDFRPGGLWNGYGA